MRGSLKLLILEFIMWENILNLEGCHLTTFAMNAIYEEYHRNSVIVGEPNNL